MRIWILYRCLSAVHGPVCWLCAQIPHKIEVARSCVDYDSIGELLCKRADKLNAAVLLMAKHKRGALKEFFIGR